MVPFALKNILADLLQQNNPTYYISNRNQSIPTQHTKLHLNLISVDEWDGTMKVRVSGYDSCTKNCNWEDKIHLVSITSDHNNLGVVSPSSTITISASERDVSEVVELPIQGDPVRFPFDNYEIKLGILLDREFKDGRIEKFTPEKAKEQLIVAVQSRIPRMVTNEPKIDTNFSSFLYGDVTERYPYVADLEFSRPSYMEIITVLLVILITAASVYAVFIGPVHDLVLNSGALVLGVWGVRAILLGSEQPGITATDVVLALIVLFLLIAITFKGLHPHISKKPVKNP